MDCLAFSQSCQSRHSVRSSFTKMDLTFSIEHRVYHSILGRRFVKQFTLFHGAIVLSCLSVTLMYCSQTVGWIKMKLPMEIGLDPGHIVLDGDPAPPKRGTSFQFSAHVHCGPTAGWIKMPQWYGCRPWPRRLCVRWGSSSPPPKKGGLPPPIFVPCLLWQNG